MLLSRYMEIIENFLEKIPALEEMLGYRFKRKDLLQQAFIHRSYFNEHRHCTSENNERLEFLGDCVLGLIVSEFLYLFLPGHAEGELSKLRSQIVEASMCSQFASKLGLSTFVFLGKGEKMNEGRGRTTILADMFEALLAAIYLDGGLSAAREFFLGHFQKDVEGILQEPAKNWKARLQDFVQKHHKTTPVYQIVSEVGPDHSKLFRVVAWIDTEIVAQGEGMSKKLAEQAAAEAAIRKLENSPT